jgi:(2S)-methylsuccinyl-CoA dehydrogenase
MSEPARARTPDTPLLADLPALAADAAASAGALAAAARAHLAARVTSGGRVSNAALEADQYAAHALAWMATYAEALRELATWAAALDAAGRLGETERLVLQIGCGEYLAQLAGGIPMSQSEIARPHDLGLDTATLAAFRTPAVETLIAHGNTDAARARLVALMLESQGAASFGATGLDDDYEMIRDQFRRFADDRVAPHAHGWHLRDELIPMAIVEEMGALGVFGLTIPEEYGGSGLSKTAMCVVSEELSRGYIGVGSLGTRSEIAAELILGGGTEAQKAEWLPKLASAEVLPTAVFTEPNTGSDLGALRTRATRDGDT